MITSFINNFQAVKLLIQLSCAKSSEFEYFTSLFDIIAIDFFEYTIKYFNKAFKIKPFEHTQKVGITFISSSKKTQGTQKNILER